MYFYSIRKQKALTKEGINANFKQLKEFRLESKLPFGFLKNRKKYHIHEARRLLIFHNKCDTHVRLRMKMKVIFRLFFVA